MQRKRIRITFADEWVDLTYTDDKECEYHTQVGVAGELILYRVTLHQLLSAKMQPEVWQVWASGVWLSHTHDEIEVDDEA